jgi:hypothetical protein
MPTEDPSSRVDQASTAAKIENLRREIQQLVIGGIESPGFELTRICSLATGHRKSQTDFAKTIQGMANAYPPEERVYVIGADQREKKFFPIENAKELDPANIRQILQKYLEPVPNFDAWELKTDDGITFVAIVVGAEQPRPILVKVQFGDDKNQFLHIGDIWIKKNTGLTKANRGDLEKIYETRIEVEAERRAERRFADTRNGLEASFRLQFSPERKIPSSDLVFGPATEYKAYIELLLANQDGLRFHMLLTSIRDLLIDKWHSIDGFDAKTSFSVTSETKVANHFQNTFLPALRRLAYAGLLLIKFNLYTEWFKRVADLLIDAFDVCNRLRGLPPASPGIPAEWVTKNTVALEALLSGRLLATYAMRMEQYPHLPELLRKCVIPIASSPTLVREPFLFWPLRASVPGYDRIAYLWQHTVQPYWLDFFGSETSYFEAASRLEFILHMNSYLATENPDAVRWVSQYRPNTKFDYWYTSDLWRYRFNPVVPLAEKIYKNLPSGPSSAFLLDLSVEHSVFQKAFQPSDSSFSGQEQQIFVAYLKKLSSWRSEAAHSSGRFAFQTDWGLLLEAPMQERK